LILRGIEGPQSEDARPTTFQWRSVVCRTVRGSKPSSATNAESRRRSGPRGATPRNRSRLLAIGPGRGQFDETADRGVILGPTQVATKDPAAGRGDADHLGEDGERSGMWWTMLLETTAENKRASANGSRLAVDKLDADALGQAARSMLDAGEIEHRR